MHGPSLQLITLLVLFGAGSVRAQDVVGARGPAHPGLLAYRGRVERFTLAPGGEVDGVLLADGTEVETPPHLSAQVTAAIRPGDTVTVRGLKAASLPLVRAVTIEDDQTGRSIADRGTSAGTEAAGPAPGTPMRREGRVRLLLHGAQGDVNGLLLTDGTTIRIAPRGASALPDAYRPGSAVVAEGEGRTSAYGTVIRAVSVLPHALDGPPPPSP
ncbi:hypothetical protein [Lichenibacterium dinghuense]|uniref:hypothetical protein n=1 Tax=Lichenibacterium dinghuense TaxID=2895977 RepID=UPI001F320E62|nr:hypothetical protein [Lichenibacterium sp. 6Y81]